METQNNFKEGKLMATRKTQPNGFWYAVYYTSPFTKETQLDFLAWDREGAKQYIRDCIEASKDRNGNACLTRDDFKIVLEDRREES